MLNIKLIDFSNPDPYERIKSLLAQVTHKTQVEFALTCAEGLEAYYSEAEYPKVKAARAQVLTLVKAWLANPNSVSDAELKEAANAATAASYASYAANSVSSAAYYAAHAAYNAAYSTASYASSAAYSAASYASNASYAASSAAHSAAYAASYAADSASTSYAARTRKLESLYKSLLALVCKNYNLKLATLETLYCN